MDRRSTKERFKARGVAVLIATLSLPMLDAPSAVAESYPGFSILKSSTTTIPDISPAMSPVYSPEAGVSCPTSSISLAGYGANVGNWAYTPGVSAPSTGSADYGVVAGINIPLGGQMANYCKEYAIQLLKQHQEDLTSRKINNQSLLVSKCLALSSSVDFSSEAFDTPEFSSLRDCRLLKNSIRSQAKTASKIPNPGDLQTRPKQDIQLFLPIR